jgi:hypothetical protein
MSDPDQTEPTRHVGPDGSAWQKAQQLVADRNEKARKAGVQRREAHERRLAQLRRTTRD